MRIQESAENYLEAILVISKRKGYVRSIDVANELSVSKPSVSVAMKSFKNEGYISVSEAGDISLTDKGREIAEKVYERHNVVASFLLLLGVSEENAYADSCKIEHVLSEESFSKLKEYVNKNSRPD